MQDGIIKGTGNSRYLKSISNFLQQYPTYQDFVAALVAGTLPIDLNGINETGWDQLGTALNKVNLLSDETVQAFGDLLTLDTPGNPVPNDAFIALLNARFGMVQYHILNSETFSTNASTITFQFQPEDIFRNLSIILDPSTLSNRTLSSGDLIVRPKQSSWDSGYLIKFNGQNSNFGSKSVRFGNPLIFDIAFNYNGSDASHPFSDIYLKEYSATELAFAKKSLSAGTAELDLINNRGLDGARVYLCERKILGIIEEDSNGN